MILKNLCKVFLIFCSGTCFAMQPLPPKYPQAQVAPQKKSTWQAAREGDVPLLQKLIGQHPDWVNSRERKKKKEGEGFEEGLTPLAWAVIYNHFDAVRFLVEQGAHVNFKDNDDQTILHMAARTGNFDMVQYLLNHGAKKDINAEIKAKGRTPLAEVLRASKDAIIHLSIENEDLPTPERLRAMLPAALTELADKESKKLSTDQMIKLINLFIRNGANPNPADATGRAMGYYINEVQLVTEPERMALLRAVGAPETPRIIEFNESNLPDAITRLQKLAAGLKKLAPNINKVIWTIQEAQKESNRTRKYNLLRVAMSLLSNVKKLMHDDKELADFFKKLEAQLDLIRTILRDTALIISGKVAAPSAPKPAVITGQAPQQVSPPASAAPSSATASRTAQLATAMPAQETAYTHLLKRIVNNSQASVSFVGSLDGQRIQNTLTPGQAAPINTVIDNGTIIFTIGPTPLGKIQFTLQGITNIPVGRTPPTHSDEEFIDIVINNNKTLSIHPA